jgi:hypothetical protein
MEKFDVHIPDLHLITDTTSQTRPQPAGRLIVLIPPNAESTTMTHRIWELANGSDKYVQLLSLCHDAAQAPGMYRQLVTMAELMRDGKVAAEAQVEIGNNWAGLVSNHYETGDMIVCLASQRVGLFSKPLSQILQSRLNAPIYILSDVYRPEKEKINRASQLVAWAGSLGLIAGFFILQARIVMLPADWIQTSLLLITLAAELWLVWSWNRRFS